VEGTLANDRATFTAVQYILALLPWFFNAAGSPKDNTNDQLTRALRECELLLPAGGRDTIIGRRPVTTVTMAYLIWPDLFIIHLGDSRCYIRRGSDLHRVTSDQAELDQPRREGLREPKSALRSGLSTVVWQTFRGADEPVLPEVYHAMVAAGDTILLCTDGLSRHVSDDGIVALLSADGTAQAKCDNLIAAANGAGGTDNITVIVSQILDDHQSPIPGGNGSSDAATQESS
jgi:serine/threonine protein phosphatase PrpC